MRQLLCHLTLDGNPLSHSQQLDVLGLHKVPIQQWINDGAVFKCWGDNIDKQQYVRDLRSDNQDEMLHIRPVLLHQNCHSQDSSHNWLAFPPSNFLPSSSDVAAVKDNLAVMVGRILTEYFRALAPFSKVASKHILHNYSGEMSKKLDVVVLDVLMKNEAKHKDILNIMRALQDYLGENYPDN